MSATDTTQDDRRVPSDAARPVGEYLCRVVTNHPVTDAYWLLRLAAPDSAPTARPGQFFHLLCPVSNAEQPFLRRPMSIYQTDHTRGELGFLYKVTGIGTRALSRLKPDDTLDVLGPLGQGFALDPSWRQIVVVGRGVGLATLAPLASEAQRGTIGVTAILSARDRQTLMSREEFADAGATVITVTDEDGTSAVETVESIITDLIVADRADAFFTCGSDRLLRLLQRLGAAHGIPGAVAIEQQMACALGMCLCCVRPIRRAGTVRHERVCWEGPVFDLQSVLSC